MTQGAVAAILDYDKSRDHTAHGSSPDCIRCKLVEALPPYAKEQVKVR
jgi:hypothetical protein